MRVKFCTECGGPLQLRAVEFDTKERFVCESCNHIAYLDPKVSACAIPVVAGKVILVKRAIDPGRGLWVFPGGYVDRGETVIGAAERETLEEVNLTVRATDLVGVYSYGTPVVVIVYACEVLGGELRIDRESLDVRAFGRDEIPWAELAFPSTRDALRDFLAKRA